MKCKIKVWKEKFAIIKAKRSYPSAFANVKDHKEHTVIIEESKYNKKDVIKINKGWRLLTFDTTLPFNLVGFMAKISKELANKKISVCVVSSYSTDHILVKDKDLAMTMKVLKKLGFAIQ